jgi:hypothetical protein
MSLPLRIPERIKSIALDLMARNFQHKECDTVYKKDVPFRKIAQVLPLWIKLSKGVFLFPKETEHLHLNSGLMLMLGLLNNHFSRFISSKSIYR